MTDPYLDAAQGSGGIRTDLRVGFLSAYFPMYEAQMEVSFKAGRLRAAQLAQEALTPHFSVTPFGVLQSSSEGDIAAVLLRVDDPDCVVYSPSMVAPGEWAKRALNECGAPVVIWNAIQVAELPTHLTHAQSTVNTSTVGCLMLANLLSRSGRPFRVVTASPRDPVGMDVLLRTIRAAATVGRLRKARFLRIGGMIPGYDDVAVSEEDLALLGPVAVTIERQELNDYFLSSRTMAPEALGSTAALWSKQYKVHEPSLALANALSRLVRDRNASGGTVNCHGSCFRDNDVIGIPACLALSILADQAIPFSCTGDLPAAIALFLAKALSGRAQYCELYTPDLKNGQVLLAAGGEGDPAWAAGDTFQIAANELYPGVHGTGDGVQFALDPGRATLLSLSPGAGGWRLAWATGEVVAKNHPELGGPNGYFQFDRTPVEAATSDWIATATTHHHALARGDLDVEIAVVATFLPVDPVRV